MLPSQQGTAARHLKYAVEKEARYQPIDARCPATGTSGEGDQIRYLRSTFAPEDGRYICLFEGKDAEQVRRLNDTAELPYIRVGEAMDLTP